MEPSPSRRLFRGSELPRLLVLAVIMVGGLGAGLAVRAPAGPSRPSPSPRAGPAPEPVVPDRSVEFETVTDRTPMSFRDNAAYAYLLEKAARRSPAELAAAEPARHRPRPTSGSVPSTTAACPSTSLGTAMRRAPLRVEAEQDGLALRGLDRHARRQQLSLLSASSRTPPRASRSAPNVSERVVFNGYFLKIMKYQAGDAPRGAPVLVGKLGWEPAAAADGRPPPRAGPARGETGSCRCWGSCS